MDGGSIGTDLLGRIVPDNLEMRRLCDKIESSLGAVIEAAERNRTELDSDLGISYNFVNSILDLRFDTADMEVKRIRTISKKGEISKPYALTKSIFPRIDVIEKSMRPKEMSMEHDFVGRITMFRDPREEINDEPGDITITFIDTEGKACNATFQLSGEDLDKAYDASKSRKNVKVSGMLVGGRHKRIESVKSFSVIE